GMDLHREVLAAAESAADTREVDAHLLLREAEAGGDLAQVDVEPLGGREDVDPALAVRHREARLRPEERLILRSGLVDTLDHDLAGDAGIAVADHDRADDVGARIVAVAVALRGSFRMEVRLLRRPLHVGDELERLVLDADPLRGPPRLLGM